MATRGWEHATPTDTRHRRQDARIVSKPRSKYGAVKVTLDGMTFDSKAEAERYQALKAQERAGEISDLTLQPRFALHVRVADAPVSMIIGEYRGDFSYVVCATGRRAVEDVKGFKTALYRWKKKHVELQYGIQIQEIT